MNLDIAFAVGRYRVKSAEVSHKKKLHVVRASIMVEDTRKVRNVSIVGFGDVADVMYYIRDGSEVIMQGKHNTSDQGFAEPITVVAIAVLDSRNLFDKDTRNEENGNVVPAD